MSGMVSQSRSVTEVVVLQMVPAMTATAIHTVPMERSMPPVAMTKVTPRPSIAYGTNDLTIARRLSVLAKLVLMTVNSKNSTKVTKMIMKLCLPLDLSPVKVLFPNWRALPRRFRTTSYSLAFCVFLRPKLSAMLRFLPHCR